MRTTLAIILLAVVLAASLAVGFEALSSFVLAQALLLVLALIVVMGCGVALRPEPQLPLLCDPFVLCCLFLSQFYVVGSIAMGIWGLSPNTFFRPPGVAETVGPLLGGVCMIACAIVGYRWDLGRLIAGKLPDFAGGSRRLPRRWVITAVVVAGLVGSLAWIEYQGGLLAKLAMGYGQGKSGAAFTLAFNTFILGTLLWAWHLVDTPTARRGHIWLFWSVLLLEVVFFGIICGIRKYLFFLFFGLVVLWVLRRGFETLPKVRAAVAVVVLLVFFAVWGSLRAESVASLAGFGERQYIVRTGTATEGYVSGMADPFGAAALVWQVFPEQEPFRHGGTTLVTLLGFIPRAIWPEKPIGIGKDITRYYVGPYYDTTQGFSVTITLPADLYANFGWPGVAFGGLLLGLVCRIVASYAVIGMRGNTQRRAARVILPTIFIVSLAEVRADMSQILAFNIMTGLPALAALACFRMDGPEEEAA